MNTQSKSPSSRRYTRTFIVAIVLVGLAFNSSSPFGWSATTASAANNTQVNSDVSPGADDATLHGVVIGNGTAGERPVAIDGTASVPPIVPTADSQTPTATSSAAVPPTATPVPNLPTPVISVNICHATSSTSNPYESLTASKITIETGHLSHTGGVFPAAGWGDVIPPF